MKKKGILSLFLVLVLTIMLVPATVLAATTTDSSGHVHDTDGYDATSGFFDWKNLIVNVNGDTGKVEKLSVSAWYNYGNPAALKGRNYGVLFIESGKDSKTDGNNSFFSNASATQKLFNQGINVKYTNYPYTTYTWSTFTVEDSNALESLNLDKDYRVWLWTQSGSDSYTFESCMGTMTRVQIHYYLSKDGGENYSLVKTVSSMGIMGANFNANSVTYPDATLDVEKTGTLAVTSAKDQEYNVYFVADKKYSVNCENETLEGLEADTEYTISDGTNTYTVKSDEYGRVPLVADDYDLIGNDITVTKSGETSGETVSIPERQDQPGKLDYTVGSTTIKIEVKDGCEYSLNGTNWLIDEDGDGFIEFEGLNVYTDYTLYYRTAATDSALASDVEEEPIKTLCEHQYDEYSSDDECHWEVCSVCGNVDYKEEHFGGEATCQSQAVCEKCGRAYGELAAHKLVKVEKQDATETTEGNKEYWHCSVCGKYFADENAENEIEKTDIVIAKVIPAVTVTPSASVTQTTTSAPKTGDSTNVLLYVFIMLAAVGVIAGFGLKKSHRI